MTPFLRLALLAGATVWAVALVLVARYLGGLMTAVLVAVIACCVAAFATLELAPSTRAEEREAPPDGRPEFAIRSRERAEIERSARHAAEE